jgi:isochorismate hydrolase
MIIRMPDQLETMSVSQLSDLQSQLKTQIRDSNRVLTLMQDQKAYLSMEKEKSTREIETVLSNVSSLRSTTSLSSSQSSGTSIPSSQTPTQSSMAFEPYP